MTSRAVVHGATPLSGGDSRPHVPGDRPAHPRPSSPPRKRWRRSRTRSAPLGDHSPATGRGHRRPRNRRWPHCCCCARCVTSSPTGRRAWPRQHVRRARAGPSSPVPSASPADRLPNAATCGCARGFPAPPVSSGCRPPGSAVPQTATSPPGRAAMQPICVSSPGRSSPCAVPDEARRPLVRALGGADVAALSRPPTGTRAHLAAAHGDLAARVDALTHHTESLRQTDSGQGL